MKRLFKFKYPKLFLLAGSIIIAYILFSNESFVQSLHGIGNIYIDTFIAGFFFTFGFTTAFSVGYFITLNTEKILLLGLIGGLGALIGDMIIFYFVRTSLKDEFKQLNKTFLLKKTNLIINSMFNHRIKKYLIYSFAGLVIASPLPDELGITLMAGFSKIKPLKLFLISFTFNTLGIIVMLLI